MKGHRRILVLGGSGQLGTALRVELERRDVSFVAPSRSELDLLQPDRLGAALEALAPDAVLNAAAYNEVARAETSPHTEQAFLVNRDAPAALAIWCRNRQVPLIHVSTDFVFDGEKGRPYVEGDAPAPLQRYGHSKWEGERAVLADLPQAVVVRTSTVFGPSRRGSTSFVGAILRNARRDGKLDVIGPPVSSPTYAPDLAAAMLDLLEVEASGLVHVANAGSCSRYELAVEAVRLARLDVEVRKLAASPDGIRRPEYSVLDTTRFSTLTGRRMRPWREALGEFLASSG